MSECMTTSPTFRYNPFMSGLQSPWLAEIGSKREPYVLHGDAQADVCIVGGGIAGVATAHFILRDTDKTLILLEGGRIAHGATGHNAGQLVSYFERPLAELVEAYGLDMAARGQADVDGAWDLLEEIIRERGLKTPMYRFQGYAGFTNMDHVLQHLQGLSLRDKAGLPGERMLIADDAPDMDRIPVEYAHLYVTLPRAELLSLLDTKNPIYFASLVGQKGCMNSARFCEELIQILLHEYPDRFRVAEGWMAHRLLLSANKAEIVGDGKSVSADRVVLCTNGFEQLTIDNAGSDRIDAKFHALVSGIVGYMAGYVVSSNAGPGAVTYFRDSLRPEDPYYYVTRRPVDRDPGNRHLVCIGGPERSLPHDAVYDRHTVFHQDIVTELTDFLHANTLHPPQGSFAYQWHGLMGYTPDGIRCVGPEPINPVLLYNVGCNGVGILPSVFGAKKIARHLSGKHVPASIFDPKDARLTDGNWRLTRAVG